MSLRAITPDDYGFIYTLEHAPQWNYRWRLRGQSIEPEKSMRLFWDGLLVGFVIIGRDSPSSRLGVVVAYDADMRNSHCKVGLLSPSGRSGDLAAEGAALFFSYLFAVFPMRKLYFEVPEFNLAEVRTLRRQPFAEEGRLSQYEFFDNKWWDRCWFSLSKSDWSQYVAERRAGGSRWMDLGAQIDAAGDGAPRAALSADEQVLRLHTWLAEFGESSAERGADLRRDVGLRSLDMLELLIGLEEWSGLEWAEQVVYACETVGDIEDLIHRRFGQT